jgi:maltokinase
MSSPDTAVVEHVRALIAAWMPTQRWFAGKGRDFTVDVTRVGELLPATPQVTVWTARATYGPDDTENYAVPLVARSEPQGSLEHVLLGTVETDAGTRWIYDALHDKDATHAWMLGIRDEAATGPVRFTRFADAADIPVDASSLVLSGEQSNTSMIFGDVAIMKVFRRLQPGVNPDIEVQGELSRLGAQNVAQLLGAAEMDVDGDRTSLAMLQQFMTSATDGWELAKASVRDLMAEADLHADEAGGDFAGEAERLGSAVAQVHADLAAAFGTQQSTRADLQARAAAMRERLDFAVTVVPQLAEVAAALAEMFARVGELTEPVPLQRIHGDLHLGQVLRTVYRWVLIDFEGEPMAAIDARRAMDFSLRDVAGMLRSFEYAGHHRIIEFGADPHTDSQQRYRANEWSTRNRDAFCAGYTETAGADPREHDILLRAFEADKAVYEAVYEARNRPTWLPIPLASLTRIATDGGTA